MSEETKHIIIRISPEIHKELKMKALLEDTSIQQLVYGWILERLGHAGETTGGWVGLDDEPTMAEHAKAVAKARAAEEAKGKK